MGAGTYWGKASQAKRATCDDRLQRWGDRLLAHPELPYDLAWIEGHRDKATQDRYQREKRSKVRWPNSRHNTMPAMACDLVPIIGGKKTWAREPMERIARIGLAIWAEMVEAGEVTGTLRWGGDWDMDGDSEDERFFDGAHFEILR